jgi:hypothetical protein
MIEYNVIVYKDRTEWYLNNMLHREDGPAIEYADGDKHWYLNGKRHREDGPACKLEDGYKAWFWKGKIITKKKLRKKRDKKIRKSVQKVVSMRFLIE